MVIDSPGSPTFPALWAAMEEGGLSDWIPLLERKVAAVYGPEAHGDWPDWRESLRRLSAFQRGGFEVIDGELRLMGGFPPADELRSLLMALHPWRKGPLRFGELLVDTEWRSDWKWQRLKGRISPLAGRRVLDVGCGNGYHLWHMLAEGARLALGVDPVQLYGCQFLAARHFAGDVPAGVLPLGIEELPENVRNFDTVFSMGVLYHRKSPVDHLEQLRGLLRSDGELVLETLVIESGEVLLPPGRYAQMRNVWFLPGLALLERLLQRTGFREIEIIDVARTRIDEQRPTEWMTFQSLPDFLDPGDSNRTIEGHPAPVRAIVRARA